MKKILYSVMLTAVALFCIGINRASAIPNPWIDCGGDISCGAKKAGFDLPVKVKNPNVRAMDGLLEITFPIDKKREVTVRKTLMYGQFISEDGLQDISGDYNTYPVNKTIKIKDGVLFNVRGEKNRFNVASFASESGYYSFSCEKGLKTGDIKRLYKLIEKAEAPIPKSKKK